MDNTLYLTDSPVKILSIKALPDGLDDDEGNWIQTNRKTLVFKWNQKTFVQHFVNYIARLPELELASSFYNFANFVSLFTHMFQPNNQLHRQTSGMMDIPDVSVKPVYFDEYIISDDPNYVTDNESETHKSRNEVS